MDKRQFLEHLIERVKAIDISEVLSRYMALPKRVSGSFLGLCPFHNDTRLGSFVVTPRMGIFKCFACDTAGDAIKFVSLVTEMNYVEATFEIARNHGLITSREYEDYFSKRRFTKREAQQIEQVSLSKNTFKNNIGDDELLSIVFNLFLDCSSLKSKHKEYLNNERKLDDETIQVRKYKSTQAATDIFMENFEIALEESEELKKKIRTLNLEKTIDVLELIPGFFQRKTKDEWRWEYAYNPGIFLPIRNADGMIVGLQVRRDVKDEDRGRYFWFSSSFASYSENFQKGTSSGSPMDVLYPKESPSKALFITEGRFKSEAIISRLGAISVSVQGVSNWKDINALIAKIECVAGIRYKGFTGFKNICIAFDTDMTYKYQVYQQLSKMSDSIEKSETGKNVFYVHWDSEFKGIDDLLLHCESTSKSELAKILNTHRKAYFDSEFDNQLQGILKEKQKENPFDLSQEDLKNIRIEREEVK